MILLAIKKPLLWTLGVVAAGLFTIGVSAAVVLGLVARAAMRDEDDPDPVVHIRKTRDEG